MTIDNFLQKLSEIKDAATVERVFGKPVELQDRSFVTVASICAGFCGGFGHGTSDEEDDVSEGEGGGGAGGMKAEPVAVVEVTDDETIVHPIVDTNKLILGGMVLSGIGLLLLSLFSPRR